MDQITGLLAPREAGANSHDITSLLKIELAKHNQKSENMMLIYFGAFGRQLEQLKLSTAGESTESLQQLVGHHSSEEAKANKDRTPQSEIFNPEQ